MSLQPYTANLPYGTSFIPVCFDQKDRQAQPQGASSDSIEEGYQLVELTTPSSPTKISIESKDTSDENSAEKTEWEEIIDTNQPLGEHFTKIETNVLPDEFVHLGATLKTDKQILALLNQIDQSERSKIVKKSINTAYEEFTSMTRFVPYVAGILTLAVGPTTGLGLSAAAVMCLSGRYTNQRTNQLIHKELQPLLVDLFIKYSNQLKYKDSIPRNLTEATKNYRKLMMKWHPDKHLLKKRKAERITQSIVKAYEALSELYQICNQ